MINNKKNESCPSFMDVATHATIQKLHIVEILLAMSFINPLRPKDFLPTLYFSCHMMNRAPIFINVSWCLTK
jgi:hypothetical protein